MSQLGLDNDVEWLGFLHAEKVTELSRRSQVCVLPYTGSFAGFPVAFAAANRLPIIATKFAGIPDHIGDLGLWIDGTDPIELAERLDRVLSDEAMRVDYGRRLRARAEQYLGWDTIARNTLEVYKSASRQAAARCASSSQKAASAR